MKNLQKKYLYLISAIVKEGIRSSNSSLIENRDQILYFDGKIATPYLGLFSYLKLHENFKIVIEKYSQQTQREGKFEKRFKESQQYLLKENITIINK